MSGFLCPYGIVRGWVGEPMIGEFWTGDTVKALGERFILKLFW